MTKNKSNSWIIMVIAFFVSCLVWYMVVSHMNPEITLHLGYSEVKLLMGDSGQEGYAYYIEDFNTIGITVEAPQLKAACLGVDDFYLTADVSGCKEGLNTVTVDVAVIKNKSVIGNKYALTHDQITVRAERLVTKEVKAEIEVEGSPIDGIVAGDPIQKYSSIQMRVPSELSEQSFRVCGSVDITDKEETFTHQVALVVLDEKGEEVDCEALQIYLNQKTMETTVPLGKQKSVKISYPDGEKYVTEGYSCTSIQGDFDTVDIIGSEKTVERIKKISIPASDLDLDTRKASYTRRLFIQEYLPEDVFIKNKAQRFLQVDVNIEALIEREMSVSTDKVTLLGAKNKGKCKILSENVTITLYGCESQVKALEEKDFVITLDVSGLEPGEHQVTPTVTLSEGVSSDTCQIQSCNSISVKISGS